MALVNILLLTSVPGLGRMGEKVTVRRGYFRNFLYPKQIALMDNAENHTFFENKRAHFESLYQEKKVEASALSDKFSEIDAIVCIRPVKDSGGLYGALTPKEVLSALSEKCNHELDIHQVQFPQSILTEGRHSVNLVLHPEVTSSISCIVAASNEIARTHLTSNDKNSAND